MIGGARTTWAFASITMCTLVATRACLGAAAPAPEPPDLSALEFAPSLPAGMIADRAPPEPEPSSRSTADVGERMLELAELLGGEQANEGVFSPGLIYSLISLASLYQELDDHIAALSVLERARQIVRVNQGLSSLDQAEMTLLKIASFEAMGRRDPAALERNFLVELAREHPNDLRVGAIYAAVADARVAAIERWLADRSEPPVIFGSGPLGRDDEVGLSTRDLVRYGLMAAQQNYVDALRATALNGSPGGPSIYALEQALIKTYYIQAQHRALFFGSDSTPYQVRKMLDASGSGSYTRMIEYGRLFQRSATQIANHLIELGDWHLLFRENEAGMAAYREARDVLVSAGTTADEIDAMLTPMVPILLPLFAPHFLDAGGALDYDGYMDVVIDLNGYGRSKRVRITAQSGTAQSRLEIDAIAARLKKHIARSQFRPRFVDGERTDGQTVAMRYYYRY